MREEIRLERPVTKKRASRRSGADFDTVEFSQISSPDIPARFFVSTEPFSTLEQLALLTAAARRVLVDGRRISIHVLEAIMAEAESNRLEPQLRFVDESGEALMHLGPQDTRMMRLTPLSPSIGASLI